VVEAAADGTVHGSPRAAMFRPVIPVSPATSVVWPTMPACNVYWLSLGVRSTPNADIATKALGGSNEATAGADGVLDGVSPPPWALASEVLSSLPPQAVSRTRAVAAVATALAAVGRSIVGYSPQVDPQ
jgi:hypothetical protein